MGRHRHARSQKSLKRPKGVRRGRKVLIVCEGDTEEIYFKALRGELKLNAVDVKVEGKACGSAPISVVEHARALMRKARREIAYDAVWCVFDRDDHESFARAIDMAQSNKMKLAVSVRQFEVWLLLHFVYTTRPWPDGDTLIKALSRHLTDYDKTHDSIPERVRPHREHALRHAAKLRSHNASVQSAPYPNPMTDVDHLVRFLVGLKP